MQLKRFPFRFFSLSKSLNTQTDIDHH